MKKVALSLILLNCNFPAFAAFLPTPYSTEISIPQFAEGFFIGGGVSFMQPTATDADLVFAFRNNGTTISQLTAKPGYDWGWVGIDVGYIFPETSNDVTLDYWHFGTQDTSNASGGVTNAILPLTVTNEDPNITDFAIQTNRVTSKPEYDVNQVALTFGQYINVGYKLQLHPNVGLQFSRINQKIDVTSFETLTGVDGDAGFFAIPVTAMTSVNSTFNGIGPRISFAGKYLLGDGFDFVGQFTSAILVGNFTSKLAAVVSEPGGGPLPLVNTFVIPALMAENSFSTFLKPHIVPDVEGKLALEYTYWMNGDISRITFTAGYQADEYFNVLDFMTTSGNLDRPAPVANFILNFAPGFTTHHMADFGFHGPFVGLRVYF